MARTNIDIDEEACAAVQRRYGLTTKRDAVNLALRMSAAEPLDTRTRAWRGAEIPAAGGTGNARSVGRVHSALANGGEVDGVRLLSEAGSPIQKSAPSGSATSSRKNVPIVRPVTRRTISASSWPCVMAW